MTDHKQIRRLLDRRKDLQRLKHNLFRCPHCGVYHDVTVGGIVVYTDKNPDEVWERCPRPQDDRWRV